MKPGPNFDVAKNCWVARSESGSRPRFGLVPDSSRSFCHVVHGGQSLTKRFLFSTEDRDAFTQTT